MSAPLRSSRRGRRSGSRPSRLEAQILHPPPMSGSAGPHRGGRSSRRSKATHPGGSRLRSTSGSWALRRSLRSRGSHSPSPHADRGQGLRQSRCSRRGAWRQAARPRRQRRSCRRPQKRGRAFHEDLLPSGRGSSHRHRHRRFESRYCRHFCSPGPQALPASRRGGGSPPWHSPVRSRRGRMHSPPSRTSIRHSKVSFSSSVLPSVNPAGRQTNRCRLAGSFG